MSSHHVRYSSSVFVGPETRSQQAKEKKEELVTGHTLQHVSHHVPNKHPSHNVLQHVWDRCVIVKVGASSLLRHVVVGTS